MTDEKNDNTYSDMILINKESYKDVYDRNVLATSALFALPCVSIFPSRVLELFSFKYAFFSISGRNIFDYQYLMQNRPEFADAYVGGYLIQFLFSLSILTLVVYLSYRSKTKVYVADRTEMYAIYLVVASVLIVALSVFLFVANDFSYLDWRTSWFADNERHSVKFMPQPMGRLVFIFTALNMAGLVVFLSGWFQLAIATISGRRILFNEIKGGKSDGRQVK